MSAGPLDVEVWSDVACPFCYIGKRQLADALARFAHRDDVTVTWRSFQLNPDQRTDPTRHPEDYLTQERGLPLAQVRQMNARVTAMGREVGIDLALEDAIIANTFRAHRALHFAKSAGRQDQLKERLMRAYFSEGRNVDDLGTLVGLGAEVGLDGVALRAALAADDSSDPLGDAVRRDLFEARQLGIGGVPFFVLDRKYGVSGAQGSDALLAALTQAHDEREHS